MASSPQFGSQFISEFRIVLLGNRGSGKTSLANMTLCRQVASPQRTAQCTKIRGVAAGRLVTVIDTPGWWKNLLVNETPEFQKQELVFSNALCLPGPHAVLLIIRMDALYSEKNKQSAVEHVELLGKDIWRHTVVVFTYGEHLQEQMVEQCMSKSEAFLEELVSKCGNRYHIFNIDRYSGSQVRELMEMIEYMVVGNSGCHYEMDRKCLSEVKELKRVVEETANQWKVMAQEEKEIYKDKDFMLSNIRMVLLGYRRSGKTSVRNNILGREHVMKMKRTRQCVKTQSEVAGKLITVVDTPGWWKTLPVRDTPELDKLEILHSISLSPPGPHALLLILRSDMPFREEEKKSVEEHMNLLGEQVWNHTILLFTHGDVLGDVTIEQYIESEGKDLKMLVAKCGNRYLVLSNNNVVDGRQISRLFEKVEDMVAANGGLCYEIDHRTSKEVRRRWRFMEKKSKMKLKDKKQRGVTRHLKGTGHFSELSLVLLGYGAAGKTSTSNTILMGTKFGSKRTSRCVRKSGEVAGRLLTVVDTPGWWKRLPIANTPQINQQEIARCRDLTSGPVAYLLVLRLDSSFQEEERRAVEDHMKLFGHTVWDHTMVLFTCGDWLGDRPIELHIESEGEAIKWILENCRNRYCIFNNENQHSNTQVSELLEKVEQLVAENKASHSRGLWYLKETGQKLGKGWFKERRVEKPNVDINSDDDDDVFTADCVF